MRGARDMGYSGRKKRVNAKNISKEEKAGLVMDWIKTMKEGRIETTSRFLACDVKWLAHGNFYLVFIIRMHKWDFPPSSHCSSLHSDLPLKLPAISSPPISEQVVF